MPAIGPGALLGLLLAPALALSAPADRPDTTAAVLPDLTVTARPDAWSSGAVPADRLDDPAGGNLGERLEGLPGIRMVRRAAGGTEPVIRGLGAERVRTLLGAVPLHGACPGHMDPPVTYLSGLTADAFAVTRHGSAAAGAGGLAGAIRADPDYERRPGAPDGWTPFVEAGWRPARDGWRAEAGVAGGRGPWDQRVTAGRRRLDDYAAPDGRTVPAGLKEASANLAVGRRLGDRQRVWTAVNWVKEEDVAYTALPMDNRDTDFRAWNAGWRAEADGLLRRLEVTGGRSTVDHLMDNADKPNFAMMAAETQGLTDTWAVRAVADLAPGGFDLAVGADLTSVLQDALRSRYLRLPDVTWYDHMWPDARQVTAGGYARLAADLGGALGLAVEGRLDAVDSRARAADDAGLNGLTVREQYIRWYGPGAADTDRTETVGQAALRLEGVVPNGRGTRWHLRSGLAARPAGIGERYLAFAPGPGGYLVGNPTLAAEKAWQNEAGLRVSRGSLAAALTAFHQEVADYVLPTVIARRDADGDGRDDTVRGFVNRDARLWGGELALAWRPTARVEVPLALSYVRGRNTADDRDLPEIPAFGGRLAVRGLLHRATGSGLEAGAEFAADQDRIDPQFGEDATPGWIVWHAALETQPLAGLTLHLRVDNLLDTLRWNHLTREAVLPLGGLAAGDEVPAEGRRFVGAVRYGF